MTTTEKTEVGEGIGNQWEQSTTTGLKFHDFKRENEFIGKYTGNVHEYRDEAHPENSWDAYIFEKKDGTRVLISKAYAIKKAIETHGANVQYRFVWNGLKEMKGGKKVNDFDVFTRDLVGNQ